MKQGMSLGVWHAVTPLMDVFTINIPNTVHTEHRYMHSAYDYGVGERAEVRKTSSSVYFSNMPRSMAPLTAASAAGQDTCFFRLI
jgi:hypothetical protein